MTRWEPRKDLRPRAARMALSHGPTHDPSCEGPQASGC